jgi:hypothetical protein
VQELLRKAGGRRLSPVDAHRLQETLRPGQRLGKALSKVEKRRSKGEITRKEESGLLREEVDLDDAGAGGLGFASHLGGVLAGREGGRSKSKGER